jgi:hypothetical protein
MSEKEMRLTPEQEEALATLLAKLEETKTHTMRCLLCNDPTYERGIVCTERSPSVPIIIGLCYPCRNHPERDQEVQRQVGQYLLSIGRGDLLE